MRVFRKAAVPAVLAMMSYAQAADLSVAPAPVTAPPSWFVHLGAGVVMPSESAKINAAGLRIPGASISIAAQVTPIVEAGYFLTPNWAVSFTGGLPPTINIKGAGSVGALGSFGKAVYGPMTLTTHYHFTNFGRFQPYVGVGVAYMKIFSTKDNVLTNLSINDAVGPALQAGVDIMIDDRWSAFVDVKKAFLRTRTTGYLGLAPIRAWATVDPLVVSTGVGYRF